MQLAIVGGYFSGLKRHKEVAMCSVHFFCFSRNLWSSKLGEAEVVTSAYSVLWSVGVASASPSWFHHVHPCSTIALSRLGSALRPQKIDHFPEQDPIFAAPHSLLATLTIEDPYLLGLFYGWSIDGSNLDRRPNHRWPWGDRHFATCARRWSPNLRPGDEFPVSES